MQVSEYEEAVLRLIQSDTPLYEDIVTEFDGVLTKQQVKQVVHGLIRRKYIRFEEQLDYAFSLSDGQTKSSTSQVYVLTPLGKNFLANTTANFTSFHNISNSNIAHQASHVQQNVQISELPDDLRQKIEELHAAIKKKDSNAITKTFAYIADKSVDIAIALLVGGINSPRS